VLEVTEIWSNALASLPVGREKKGKPGIEMISHIKQLGIKWNNLGASLCFK